MAIKPNNNFRMLQMSNLSPRTIPVNYSLENTNIGVNQQMESPLNQIEESSNLLSGLKQFGKGTSDFMNSKSGNIALGALGGLIGSYLGNKEIESQNAAVQRSMNTISSKLDELKRQRLEAIKYRRSEAQDFLTNYATVRDPNKSSQIAQMYQTGQDRFRNELSQSDAMNAQFTGQLAQLQGLKQKPKGFGETVAETALGAVQLLPYALMG